MDTQLVLGDVTFKEYEIPERIPGGGNQSLAVHQLLGGTRVVDTLGEDNDSLRWRGRFQGPDARDRARHLDFLRKQGLPQFLTWDGYTYRVVIQRFEWDFERWYQIPYEITCVVVQDLTLPLAQDAPPNTNDMMNGDTADAGTQATALAMNDVSTKVTQIQTDLAPIPDVTLASASQVATLHGDVVSARNAVAGEASTANGTIAGAGAVGGLQPGAPPAQNAAALSAQVAAASNAAQLAELDGTLGRMQANLETLG